MSAATGGETICQATTLGELVTARPDLAPALEELGLDYCCGGARSLADACREAGLDVDESVGVLSTAGSGEAVAGGAAAWADLDLAALTEHIEATHHEFLRHEFPRLGALAERVETVHGDRHPELYDVRRLYQELVADLEPHLLREEQILFPLIRELDAATRSHRRPVGTLGNSVEVLADDHEQVGALMAALRDATDAFTVPADGCASYRSLYEGLSAFVRDTHMHVHKENNVLFPAAFECERAVLAETAR